MYEDVILNLVVIISHSMLYIFFFLLAVVFVFSIIGAIVNKIDQKRAAHQKYIDEQKRKAIERHQLQQEMKRRAELNAFMTSVRYRSRRNELFKTLVDLQSSEI